MNQNKEINNKTCLKCKTNKPITEFYKIKKNKDGYHTRCNTCNNQERIERESLKKLGLFVNKSRQPRLNLTEDEKITRKENEFIYQKKYRKENYRDLKTKEMERLNKDKRAGIEYYGGCCQCCGEKEFKFLTLEHLDGREKHERTGKYGWRKARIMGYPDNLTVLCFNCNCAKGIYGICPHKTGVI